MHGVLVPPRRRRDRGDARHVRFGRLRPRWVHRRRRGAPQGPHRCRVREGDALVALPSAGLHTNGYSLARKVLFERCGLGSTRAAELGATVGERFAGTTPCSISRLFGPFSRGTRSAAFATSRAADSRGTSRASFPTAWARASTAVPGPSFPSSTRSRRAGRRGRRNVPDVQHGHGDGRVRGARPPARRRALPGAARRDVLFIGSVVAGPGVVVRVNDVAVVGRPRQRPGFEPPGVDRRRAGGRLGGSRGRDLQRGGGPRPRRARRAGIPAVFRDHRGQPRRARPGAARDPERTRRRSRLPGRATCVCSRPF